MPSEALPQAAIAEFNEGLKADSVELSDDAYGSHSSILVAHTQQKDMVKKCRYTRPINENTTG